MTAGSKPGERRGGRKPLLTQEIYNLLRRFPNGLKATEIAEKLKYDKSRIAMRLTNSVLFQRNPNCKWTVVDNSRWKII